MRNHLNWVKILITASRAVSKGRVLGFARAWLLWAWLEQIKLTVQMSFSFWKLFRMFALRNHNKNCCFFFQQTDGLLQKPV